MKPRIATEKLVRLALPGDAKLTDCQRALCLALDGLPIPDELWDADNTLSEDYPEELRPAKPVQHMFGYVRPPEKFPKEALILAGTRTGKSLIAAAAGSRMALTVDTRRMGERETARVSLLSVALDNLDAIEEHLMAIWNAPTPLQKIFHGNSSKKGFHIRRPDDGGRSVFIKPVAGAAAGKSLVSRWMGGVIFDEAARMTSRGDGKINIQDSIAAVRSRLLPGAQLLEISSPWAPHGYVYNQVKDHFGKSHHRVLIARATGPMLNPVEWTAAKCRDLKENAPLEYLVDCKAEFVQSEMGLFSKDAIERNTRPGFSELRYRPLEATYVAACDPSSGAGGANGFAMVVIEIPMKRDERLRVAAANEWRGMDLRVICAEAASLAKRYGISTTYSDRWAAAPMTALMSDYGLDLRPEGLNATEQAKQFADAAALISKDDIELPPNPQLCDDLLSAVMRPNIAGGWRIELPNTADGRHADYAPAFVKAAAKATSVTAARVNWAVAIENMASAGMLQ